MQKLIVFSAFLALAAAAPGLLLSSEVHLPLGKTTITKSSQLVDHGSTYVHSVPVVHAPVVHVPVHSYVHAPAIHISMPSKTTVTRSSQVVDHGSTTLVHAPAIHLSVPSKTMVTKSSQVVDHGSTTLVHTPVVHAPVLVHSSPLVTYKTGDSAVSHHSSTVHETVPIVVHH